MIYIKRSLIQRFVFVLGATCVLLGWFSAAIRGNEWIQSPLMLAFAILFVTPVALFILFVGLSSLPLITVENGHITVAHSFSPIIRRQSRIDCRELISVDIKVEEERFEYLVFELNEDASKRILNQPHVFVYLGENRFGYDTGNLTFHATLRWYRFQGQVILLF